MAPKFAMKSMKTASAVKGKIIKSFMKGAKAIKVGDKGKDKGKTGLIKQPLKDKKTLKSMKVMLKIGKNKFKKASKAMRVSKDTCS